MAQTADILDQKLPQSIKMAKTADILDQKLLQSIKIVTDLKNFADQPSIFPGFRPDFPCKFLDFRPFPPKSSKIAFSYDWGKICMYDFAC